MNLIGRYWKAIAGFAAPAAVIIASATAATSDGGDAITKAEWITAACAAVITAAGVGFAKNRPANPPNDV